MHSHPALVGVVLKGGRAKFTMPDGKSEVVEMKTGQILNFDATEHLPENVGDSAFEAILVELKG